ncbi:hypothetical protein FNT36_01225 [Hymenobacter setariae]|uniref:Uncharacterized protein n=1 Tax=Hymenobacter setariae TaxID=2594794 RepID=A0A558C1S9_9BACT|nr:hypothetical protein [Hymenobacter setariae]TVT42745.1 hypothetical protein FNT36_01225 [Hymenobacter setariae]
MPKLIDYPRTSYTGAWEIAEVVDDTGGKCALETCARKLNRKVSGSFKAIIGSAVKFGLLTSKREMLTTTTLFRRIKHAYDKQEELVFHREAFLTPPLFTQLCRKFRSRELPAAMLDVLLIREFDVEEINAQSVAKAFIDGACMVGILDENNIVADIDQLAAQQPPRRELASPPPAGNIFRQSPAPAVPAADDNDEDDAPDTNDANSEPETTGSLVASTVHTPLPKPTAPNRTPLPAPRPAPAATTDAIAHLFGFNSTPSTPTTTTESAPPRLTPQAIPATAQATPVAISSEPPITPPLAQAGTADLLFRIQLVGPGLNTQLDVVDIDDLALVRALLDKIERRLKQ